MQSIQTPLLAVMTADFRIPRIKVRASWLKVADTSTVYAVVGTSLVDGNNLVQGHSVVITNADLFSYMDETDYTMRLEYDRRIDEPRGGISYAIANVLMDNITRRFEEDHNATIGTAIEARRPFKMSIGFEAGGTDRLVQVIVGLTANRPKSHQSEKAVEVDIFDYITFINNQTIAAAIYEDQRSDEIIEDILVTLGFGSSQYELDTGLNTIPFAWFDKNKSAGQRIKEICEAEEATFYQDENGVLRFENRNHYANYPYQSVQRTIDPDDIITDEEDESTKIINRAIVTAKPRKVDADVSVLWTNSTVFAITPGQSTTIWAAFYEETGNNVLPVKEITTPAGATDYIGNTAEDGSGTVRTADLSLVVTNFVETAKIVITNNHGSDTVYVTTLQLRGKAARVTQAIQAVVEDANSINKYESQEYPVQNDLIQTSAMATILATNLVNKYKDPMKRRVIRIPGIPHLQLKDLLNVINPSPENLIPNGSFEVNTENWSKVAVGGTTSFDRARDVPINEGFFAGKIIITSVPTSCALNHNLIRLITGHVYRLTMNVRTNTQQSITVKMTDSTAATVSLNQAISIAADRWEKLSFEFTAGVSDFHSILSVILANQEQEFWIDTLRLIDLTKERKEYRLMRIKGSLLPGSFIQTLTLREKTTAETA